MLLWNASRKHARKFQGRQLRNLFCSDCGLADTACAMRAEAGTYYTYIYVIISQEYLNKPTHGKYFANLREKMEIYHFLASFSRVYLSILVFSRLLTRVPRAYRELILEKDRLSKNSRSRQRRMRSNHNYMPLLDIIGKRIVERKKSHIWLMYFGRFLQKNLDRMVSVYIEDLT